MKLFTDFTRGLFRENPIFRLLLGMCPTLAVTTSLENALGMGLASTFVLVCSNVVISLLRNVIPSAVRIPCFIVVIATFVTVVDLLMQAYAPALAASLGIFIPLIVVNCIILGRAEAFASKNPVIYSIADGIGMGIGFTVALAIIASMREFLGAGSITVWGDIALKGIHNKTMVLFVLPAGGFISLGLIIGFINHIQALAARAKGGVAPLPLEMDCRHCNICKFGK
ncbi:MAG: electron transport complex subunit E [Kiritimatiellae bacterium]|nr:electron transport complex subunit E [Kiritimatiellia bacterium]